MNIKGYAREFFRGVSLREHLNEDLSARASVFTFDEKRTASQRTDSNEEESINWNDDQNALNFTLNQKKKNSDTYMFIGVITLRRKDIDYIRKLPTIRDILSYERKNDEDNPENIYHGNLLLRKDTPKHIKASIKGTIATHCARAIMRDSSPAVQNTRKSLFLYLYSKIIQFVKQITNKH
jgi:hypothetical protein